MPAVLPTGTIALTIPAVASASSSTAPEVRGHLTFAPGSLESSLSLFDAAGPPRALVVPFEDADPRCEAQSNPHEEDNDEC